MMSGKDFSTASLSGPKKWPSTHGVTCSCDEQDGQAAGDVPEVLVGLQVVHHVEHVKECTVGEGESHQGVVVVCIHLRFDMGQPSVGLGPLDLLIVREYGELVEHHAVSFGTLDLAAHLGKQPSDLQGGFLLASGTGYDDPVDVLPIPGDVTPDYEGSHAVSEQDVLHVGVSGLDLPGESEEVLDEARIPILMGEETPGAGLCVTMTQMVVRVYSDVFGYEELRERRVAEGVLQHTMRYLHGGTDVSFRDPCIALDLAIPSG